MNELIQKSFNTLTMSSREIATLCDKEHSNVLRDIRAMLINLYGDEYVRKTIPEQYRNRHSEYIRENADQILTAIAGHSNWNDEQNQTLRGYKWHRDNRGYITEIWLDKDHTLTLVTGYNAKLRMAIIKRWQELEQLNTPTDPLLMIAHMAQQAYETKLLTQQVAQRQDSMEQTIREVQAKQEALTDSSNFFSVLAFSNLHDVGLTNGKLVALSKKAGKLSEKLGVAVGTISDPRWGKVKTYHKDVLIELFEKEQLI